MSDKPNATRYSNEDKSEIDYLRDVEDWADARIAELESKVAELEALNASLIHDNELLTIIKDKIMGWEDQQ